MITKIFSVYDSKAEAHMQPFFMQSSGQAFRSFMDIATDETHMIGKHPEDFALFELGEYDDSTSKFIIRDVPKLLASALDVIARSQQ